MLAAVKEDLVDSVVGSGVIMSRSRKKAPYVPITTASSEKEDKQIADRKNRRVNKTLLTTSEDDAALRDRKEFGSGWCFSKDGKQRIDPSQSKDLRK